MSAERWPSRLRWFPILLLILLGIIELAFLMRDHAVVVVRHQDGGARIASTGANAGRW